MSTAAVNTITGLTAAQVAERRADGRTNDVPDAPVRTLGQIVRANVLTPVNAIISTLFVLILIAGFPADALFAGVVISNSVIGIVQELRARRTLHQLELLNAPKAMARRDGNDVELAVSEVVADELLVLRPGDQVVVDGEVVSAVGLDLDESLLTGESEPVTKHEHDSVMSGSFVSSGSGRYMATAIGADSYAAKLADEARVFKLADSELRNGVNTILRWLTFIIPPASLLLLIRLLGSDEVETWREALQGTVAAAVAMVPDGLVLLTSLAFIVGIISLARRKALAKELASVELLRASRHALPRQDGHDHHRRDQLWQRASAGWCGHRRRVRCTGCTRRRRPQSEPDPGGHHHRAPGPGRLGRRRGHAVQLGAKVGCDPLRGSGQLLPGSSRNPRNDR